MVLLLYGKKCHDDRVVIAVNVRRQTPRLIGQHVGREVFRNRRDLSCVISVFGIDGQRGGARYLSITKVSLPKPALMTMPSMSPPAPKIAAPRPAMFVVPAPERF
jgi:hypothetical protein